MSIEGIMWLLTFMSLIGALLVASKALRAGHGVWVVANIGWCLVWATQSQVQALVLFFAYFVLSVYGFWNHSRGSIENRYEFVKPLSSREAP